MSDKTYKITETIIYYVEAKDTDTAWETFDSRNYDKADASKVYREIEEVGK